MSADRAFQFLAQRLIASQTIEAEAPLSNELAAPASPAPPIATGIDEQLRERVRKKIEESERESALFGVVFFQAKVPLAGLKGRLLHGKLMNIGEVRHFSPSIEQLEELEELASLEFGVVTEKSLETVKQLLQVGGVTKVEIEPLAKTRGCSERRSATGPIGGNVRRGRTRADENARRNARRAEEHFVRRTACRRGPGRRLGGKKGKERPRRQRRQTHRDPAGRYRAARPVDEPGGTVGDQQGPIPANRRQAQESGERTPIAERARRHCRRFGQDERAVRERDAARLCERAKSRAANAAGPRRTPPRRGIAHRGPCRGQRPLRDDSPAGSRDGRHSTERDGHANAAHRPAVSHVSSESSATSPERTARTSAWK